MGDIDKELEKETKAQSSDENKGEVVFATTPHKENSGSSTVFASASSSRKASNQRGSYKRASYRTSAPENPKTSKKTKAIIISAISVVAVAGICVGVASLIKNNNSGDTVPAVVSTVSSESLTDIDVKKINTDSIVFGKNVTVQGVNVSGMTLSNAYKALADAEKSVRDNINITVKNGKKSFNLTQDDFTYEYNTADVLIDAYHFSRGELDNPSAAHNKNEAGVTDFPLTAELSDNAIDLVADKIAKKVNIKAIDAHVKKFDPTANKKFTYEDGTVGKELDKDGAIKQLNTIMATSNKTGTINVSLSDVPFKVDLKTIKTKTELITSFETTSTNVWASNHNMQLAMEAINGSVIKPGATWSFNKSTGDTTTGELGYVKSSAIVNGSYEPQYGGGICQAATTIYNAGLRANMEIVERLPHQYASTYVPVGLDATIDYGNIDLKMKNTSAYAMYMATYMYDNNGDGYPELMVEIYGEKPTSYDEIVPIAWCVENTGSKYSTYSARVYFKNGKEIKRERVWRSTYDYHGESAYQLAIPDDIENGPKDVQPTNKAPVHYG